MDHLSCALSSPLSSSGSALSSSGSPRYTSVCGRSARSSACAPQKLWLISVHYWRYCKSSCPSMRQAQAEDCPRAVHAGRRRYARQQYARHERQCRCAKDPGCTVSHSISLFTTSALIKCSEVRNARCSPLLRLPPELRNEIFELVLAEPT